MSGTVGRELNPPWPNSAFGRWLRGSRRLEAIPDFEKWAGADWAERVLQEDSATTLHTKQGRTISYWSVTNEQGQTLNMYLKRHWVLPRWMGLLAALRPHKAYSPGLSEWEHLRWAESHGIPVARPIAAGEIRGPHGRMQSFLAVEDLVGMLPLHEAIPLAYRTLSPADFARWKRALIHELARLTRELHKRSTFHKDLYLCHFYLKKSLCLSVPETFQQSVYMIDFHRLSRHTWTHAWFQIKDLAQLLFSTHDVPGITARDRVRFWKLYREADWNGLALPPAWIRWGVRRKWKLYERHNRRQSRRIKTANSRKGNP